MAEPQDVAEELQSYAKHLVKRLVRARSLEWDHARMEDAGQIPSPFSQLTRICRLFRNAVVYRHVPTF